MLNWMEMTMISEATSIRLTRALGILAALLAIGFCSPDQNAFAQPASVAAPSSVLPSGGGQALLDPSDTVILLLDHQSGLFQTVKDISIAELRANTTLIAKVATLLKVPVITTASEPNGPNGPLMPEIDQSAPHAVYVPRKGEVNAWDNEDFVKTVRATGRKTLIMAGVWTSVCVMFPALDAKAAGFKVYAVTDASGDPRELACVRPSPVSRRPASSPRPRMRCCPRCTARGTVVKQRSLRSCMRWRRRTTPP